MKTTTTFDAYTLNEEKIKSRHFFEIEYGTVPRSHMLYRLFAVDDLDAIDRLLDIFPDAIIYEVTQIGR